MTQTSYLVGRKTDINWQTADVRALLLGGTSVPAGCHDDSLTTVAAILAVSGAAEVNCTNYTRKTTTRSDSVDAPNHRTNQALSADLIWTALGGALNDTCRAILFYVEGATDSLRIPISLHDFGTAIPTNGSDVKITAQDIQRRVQV